MFICKFLQDQKYNPKVSHLRQRHAVHRLGNMRVTWKATILYLWNEE